MIIKENINSGNVLTDMKKINECNLSIAENFSSIVENLLIYLNKKFIPDFNIEVDENDCNI